MRRFIVARGIRDADVDDCLQDVWKEVAAQLAEFQHPGNRPGLRAWLFSVVRSKATDIVRHKMQQGIDVVDVYSGRGFDPSSREPDPAAPFKEQWNEALARTMMEELRSRVSDINYRILYLRFIENRNVNEVAETLEQLTFL